MFKHIPGIRGIFSLCICLLMLLSGCDLKSLDWNPQGDWTYELCENYCIFRVNSSTIVLTVKEDDGRHSIVVNEYLTRFCYNDRFIAVRRLAVPEYAMFEDIMKMDFEQAVYYLIDAQCDEILGPFADKEAFDVACAEKQTGDLGAWIDTYPAPKDARF